MAARRRCCRWLASIFHRTRLGLAPRGSASLQLAWRLGNSALRRHATLSQRGGMVGCRHACSRFPPSPNVTMFIIYYLSLSLSLFSFFSLFPRGKRGMAPGRGKNCLLFSNTCVYYTLYFEALLLYKIVFINDLRLSILCTNKNTCGSLCTVGSLIKATWDTFGRSPNYSPLTPQ